MDISDVINLLTAIGTLLVAIAAIWGDWLKHRFNPPKAELKILNPLGEIETYSGGEPIRCYHLKVSNMRKGQVLNNCRVMLSGVKRKGPDGKFHDHFFPVPRQFIWAPSESTPSYINISSEQTLDFGFLFKDQKKFKLSLHEQGGNLNSDVIKDESVRYLIEIVADNYKSDSPFVVEVSWDGGWDDEGEMARKLVIKHIP